MERTHLNRTCLAALVVLALLVLEASRDLRGQTGFTPSGLAPSKTVAEERLALLHHHLKNPPVHVPSQDCSGSAPSGYTRIFIAYRTDTKPGTGTALDPFDGSNAQKFDALLRIRSESGVTHLVVCIGPGTFQTEGTHDYLLGRGHFDKRSRGALP